jgi:zinc-binding alcohol dehydrogenase/oxidoreductase
MKVVQLEAFGGPEGLQMAEIADPAPRPGEVLVEIEAAALNRRDLWIRVSEGRCALPCVLGSDAAGRIASLGEGVRGVNVGDEVVIDPALGWGDREDAPQAGWEILGVPHQGTYAELVAVPSANIHHKPERLSWHEAASLPLAGLTAWRALVTRGHVEDGMAVLITGAGSGVATFLVQIARAHGARVLVTSSSEEKISRAADLGAERGVLYTHDDWPEQVGFVDLIIDSAGAPVLEHAFRCLRPGGTVVSFGDTSGDFATIDVGKLYWDQLNVLGSTMGSPREFEQLIAHVDAASWNPVIDSVFPLESAALAHSRLDAVDRFGKIVLQVR